MATAKPTAKPKTKRYTPEERERHCNAIVHWIGEGKTLRDYCRKEDSPGYVTIYDWMREDKVFDERIARARDAGYDIIAEEALAISNTPLIGERVTESEDGKSITREDMLGHRKLQIETRLKLLAKWNPKKYGDRLTHSGDDEAPIVAEVSFDIFGELLKSLTLQRQTNE